MKKCCFIFILFGLSYAQAQKIDNIVVNLYTDSLKKGTYNYINIDGELSNGNFLPLDSNKIAFHCATAKFTGNSIFIPTDFPDEKVRIRVLLREDETKYKEFDMYVQRTEDPPLKTSAEIMEELRSRKKRP